MQLVVSLILFVLFLCPAAKAMEPENEIMFAYSVEDYDRVLELAEPLLRSNAPEAQYVVGLMYYHGEGLAQNTKYAIRLLEISASQDFEPSLHVLGLIYVNGMQVERDVEQGLKLLLRAGEKRWPNSELILGKIYATGEVVPEDLVEAHMWLNLAVYDSDAVEELQTDATESLAAVERLMRPEQISEAKKRFHSRILQ